MATFEPFYTSERQRLYSFPNGHGASVVKRADGHELAVISVKPPEKSFWINYRTPFGPPKGGLDEAGVQSALEQVAALPDAAHKIGEKP